MIDLDEARKIADEFVALLSADNIVADVELAVIHDKVIICEQGWIFNYNSLKSLLEPDNRDHGILGTFPFFVSKMDGSLYTPASEGEFGALLRNQINKYRF